MTLAQFLARHRKWVGIAVMALAFISTLSLAATVLGFFFSLALAFAATAASSLLVLVQAKEVTVLVLRDVFTGLLRAIGGEPNEGGLYWKLPWEVLDPDNKFTTQLATVVVSDIYTTKDKKNVQLASTVQYMPKRGGHAAFQRVSAQFIEAGIKSVLSEIKGENVAQYTLDELRNNTAIVSKAIKDAFEARAKPSAAVPAGQSLEDLYGIDIVLSAIGVLDEPQKLKDAYTTAAVMDELGAKAKSLLIAAGITTPNARDIQRALRDVMLVHGDGKLGKVEVVIFEGEGAEAVGGVFANFSRAAARWAGPQGRN